MKRLAIPTRDGNVDDHFGHCAYYSLITLSDEGETLDVERMDSPQGCGCKSNVAQVLREKGVTLMLAGNMGDGALAKLTAHGIEVVRGCHGSVTDVLNAYQKGELKDSGNACSHHDCHSENKETQVFKVDIKR